MSNVVRLHRPHSLSEQERVPACIDCKWHGIGTPLIIRAIERLPEDHICKRSCASIADPVTGRRFPTPQYAVDCRSIYGHCGPEGKNFEEMHWSLRYRPVIVLAVIVLIVLFGMSWSKADEPLPDSWAAQIELTEDPVFVPGAPMTEFEAEFGARMQPREGEMEEDGELDPTGKPVDMTIENLEPNKEK